MPPGLADVVFEIDAGRPLGDVHQMVGDPFHGGQHFDKDNGGLDLAFSALDPLHMLILVDLAQGIDFPLDLEGAIEMPLVVFLQPDDDRVELCPV